MPRRSWTNLLLIFSTSLELHTNLCWQYLLPVSLIDMSTTKLESSEGQLKLLNSYSEEWMSENANNANIKDRAWTDLRKTLPGYKDEGSLPLGAEKWYKVSVSFK